VRYTLEQIDGRSWLVRRQDALDVRTSENVQRDLVCCGFRGFQLFQDAYAWGLDEEATEGEAPVDGPPAGGGAAAARTRARTEKDVRFTEDGERRTYTIGATGAGYYFEFLPAWMQQQILNHGRIVHDLTATVEDQQRQLEQAIRDTGVDLRGAGTVWRLRVWTGEQGDTLRERIVTIRLGGGA
jgi:ribosomal protein S18